jgi:hypothetical protein
MTGKPEVTPVIAATKRRAWSSWIGASFTGNSEIKLYCRLIAHDFTPFINRVTKPDLP